MVIDWSKIRKNKYKNQKTIVDGIRFDSKKEANYYVYLKALQGAGKIKGLSMQPRFELQPGYRGPDGQWVRPLAYVADFRYTDAATGQTVIVDVKSKATEMNPVYRLKRKLFLYRYRDLIFKEIVS